MSLACAAAILALGLFQEKEDPEAGIRTLVDALGSDSIERRERAERALARHGDLAEPALLEALEHGDVERRSRAEGLLDRIRWNRACPVFCLGGASSAGAWIINSRTGETQKAGGVDAMPHCSPDGKGFAYQAENWIKYRDFDSGGEVLLTRLESVTHADVQWSPDGTRLLLISEQQFKDDGSIEDAGYARIYVVDRVANVTRLLTPWKRRHLFACWSPDGTQIAYVSGDLPSKDSFNTFDLFVIDARGGEPRRLTWDLAPKYAVRWSPDGSRIAFEWEDPTQVSPEDPKNGSGGPLRIGILNLRTGRAERITTGDDRGREPQWSPDGTRLAFFRYTREDPENDLCVSDPDGGGLRAVLPRGPARLNVLWSPDARRLLFTEYVGKFYQISVVHSDGTGYRTLLEDCENACWLPRR